MITKFKQGSYKLSAMAVVLILLLGAVLLTNAKVESNASSRAESPEEENPVAQFEVDRLIPSYKWFNNLNRAINFSKFEFKVPDYMPERYQLENINLGESFAKAHKADLINSVSITFVSNFGQKDEHYFEMVAAKGNGTLLEHNFLWGAPYPQALDRAPSDKQEDMTIGNINGVMYTTTKIWSKQKPETAKSFVWQDNGVMYTINFYSNDLSQDELAKVVQSFVSPGQVQHVDYKGEGNSFALYDETDLQEAKRILGFPVKIPVDVSDYGLKLSDSSLMRADDQNTKFYFRPDTDVLWNSYRVPFNSPMYELNDSIEFYQSKAPVVDVKRLSFLRKLEMNGIGITAYADNDNIYTEPVHSDSNQLKFKTQTFYVWQQNGVYYTAHFYGVDKHQEENLNALVLAPVE
ncbi:DUF4367 domain-containing protein [Paenibacillus sepulcri]|uniref:DUF4367 domain-containing protein n=3 Tax=Paenibacillus sepulcri TaxID=359917 RepID=A0ABS7CCE7_9BACL|nr:DUF4367 domain-containing protein [Paenibacillus sepulcri]